MWLSTKWPTWACRKVTKRHNFSLPTDGLRLLFELCTNANPDTKDSCHFASLCGNLTISVPLYPNELGQLDTNPNFKLIGDLKNNVALSDLRQGDLLTYYVDDGTMDGGRILHSDRIFLIDNSKIIVFDKPSPGAPYSFLDLSTVIDNPNFDWSNILVYRKWPTNCPCKFTRKNLSSVKEWNLWLMMHW